MMAGISNSQQSTEGLLQMMKKREKLNLSSSAHLILALDLIPIKSYDHFMIRRRNQPSPTFIYPLELII